MRRGANRYKKKRGGFAWRPFGSEKRVVHSAYGIYYVYPDSNITLGQVRTPRCLVLQVLNNDVPTRTTLVPRRTLGDFFLGQPLVDRNATPNISTVFFFKQKTAYEMDG